MAENEYHDEPNAGDDLPLQRLKDKRPNATEVLPRLMLQRALAAADLGDLAVQACCIVIVAPSAEWVAPLQLAAAKTDGWDYVCAKAAHTRGRRAEDDGADGAVASVLAKGGRVLGVSHDPDALLPPTIVSAADRVLRVSPPNASIIAQTIMTVVGDQPTDMEDADCVDLTFEEISASIRLNSSAQKCVERIRRVGKAKKPLGVSVVDAPLLPDLHGYGEAKQWGLNLAEDLEAWRRGEISLDAVERMVVLASPPGFGKTTFARSVAKTTGLPLIATSVGKWFAESPGYLDSVIKKIDEVFATARASAPCVLLLDELDGLPSRATISPRGADWWLPVIGHMLTTLDGAEERSKDLIVIGATNHPERLDSALVRSGRFSRVIHVPQPTKRDLIGIFRQHLGAELPDADLEEVAALGSGGTGADVVEWIKRARGLARRASRSFELQDLVDVLRRSDDRPADDVRRTSVHEAGHAVLAHHFGVKVHSLSIVQSRASSGHTTVLVRPVNTKEEVHAEVIRTLAGRAAEEVLLSEVSAGAGGNLDSDLATATRWLCGIHLSFGLGGSLLFRADLPDVLMMLQRDPVLTRRVNEEMAALYGKTLDLVRVHRGRIEKIANELMTKRHLDAEQFLELMEGA